MPTVVLAPNLIQQFTDNSGNLLAGGFLYSYQAGTNTPYPTYVDATGATPNTNPIVLNARGEIATNLGASCGLWVPPNVAYDFYLTDANNNPIWNEKNVITPQFLPTQASLGAILYPPTQAEINTGVTINTSYPYGNLLRCGMIPNANVLSVAVQNQAFLQAYLNPNVAGPTGQFYSPNLTGSDIYYFNGMTQIRNGCHIDFNDTTWNFTATPSLSDTDNSFLFLMQDVTLENGTLIVNGYTMFGAGTPGGASNAGNIIGIGARGSPVAGSALPTVYDSLLPVPMGLITLRNLRLQSNVPGGTGVLALGGIQGWIVENVVFDGQGTIAQAFYYEYGWATNQTNEYQRQTSHAHNIRFTNVTVQNLGTTAAVAFGFNGAWSFLGENLVGYNMASVFEAGPGEALYYNPWIAFDVIGAKRNIDLRNIVGQGITSTAVSITGASLASGSYLAPLNLGPQYQTDLLDFSIDGFAFDSGNVSTGTTGYAISSSAGRTIIRNGTSTNMGRVISLGAECTWYDISDVRGFGAWDFSVQIGFPDNIWSPTRSSKGRIVNCFFAGGSIANAGLYPAIDITQSASCTIEDCLSGYTATHDGMVDQTQAGLVWVESGSSGVVCRNNTVGTVNGSNDAYFNRNSGQNQCYISNALGVSTTQGYWGTDFQQQTAQTPTSSQTINTQGFSSVRVNPAGNITGVILQAGSQGGTRCTVFNESAFSITFAVSGTSNVSDGTGDVIATLTARTYVWNSSKSLWYPSE